MLSRRRLSLLAVTALLALVTAAACGGGQAKSARAARYKADTTVVFKAVVDAVNIKHKVERADAPTGVVLTVPRWHEPEGNYEDMDASGNAAMLQDGSVLLRFEVRVVTGTNPGELAVEVIPHVAQMRSGYARPVDLKPGDLAIPGWVEGKTDDLYVNINAKLKAYEVKPGA